MLVKKPKEHRHHGYCMQSWSASTKRDIEEAERVERRMKGLMRSRGPLTCEERIKKPRTCSLTAVAEMIEAICDWGQYIHSRHGEGDQGVNFVLLAQEFRVTPWNKEAADLKTNREEAGFILCIITAVQPIAINGSKQLKRGLEKFPREDLSWYMKLNHKHSLWLGQSCSRWRQKMWVRTGVMLHQPFFAYSF